MRFLYTDVELDEIKSAYEKIKHYFDLMSALLRSPISLQIKLYDTEFRLYIQPYYNSNYPRSVSVSEVRSTWSYYIVGNDAHGNARSPMADNDGRNAIIAIIHNWKHITDMIENHLDEQAQILMEIGTFNQTMENA